MIYYVTQVKKGLPVTTRFFDYNAAVKYATAVNGEVILPRKASSFAQKLFAVLRKA